MNTVNWSIREMTRDAITGFVTGVHWHARLNDGVYSSSCYGAVSFQQEGEFVPFSELTESDVLGWVHERLGADVVSETERYLAEQIKIQKTPTFLNGLPWEK